MHRFISQKYSTYSLKRTTFSYADIVPQSLRASCTLRYIRTKLWRQWRTCQVRKWQTMRVREENFLSSFMPEKTGC